MKKYVFIIFTMIVLSACDSTSPSSKIEDAYKGWGEIKKTRYSDSLKISKDNSVAILQYNSENKLMRLETFINEHPYGHKFQFDPEGNLYLYQFFVNPSSYSYEIDRIFMGDSLVERGSPFVDYMKKKEDEKQISLLFSNFPRRIANVQLSIDGIKYTDIRLYNSRFMPLLLESDIFMPSSKKIFLKIKTNESLISLFGLNDQQLFYDTTTINLD